MSTWIVVWIVASLTFGAGWIAAVVWVRRQRWSPGDPADPSVVAYVNLGHGAFRVRGYHVLAVERERLEDGLEDVPGEARILHAPTWEEATPQLEQVAQIPVLWDWKSGGW